MATMYFPMNTKQAALAQSETFWNRVLGRAKLPQDTTQFLFDVMTNPNTGESMLVVDQTGYDMVYPKLSQAEKNAVDANLVPVSDPRVQAILNSQPKLPEP